MGSQVEKTLGLELGKVSTWLSDNKLSLHLGKTESILFGSSFNLNKVDNFTVKVGDTVITRKDAITYLGCILEANLSSDGGVVYLEHQAHCKMLYSVSYREP